MKAVLIPLSSVITEQVAGRPYKSSRRTSGSESDRAASPGEARLQHCLRALE